MVINLHWQSQILKSSVFDFQALNGSRKAPVKRSNLFMSRRRKTYFVHLVERVLKRSRCSLSAFMTDLDSYQDEVVLMTMTEFGRTVHENGSGGTDHGRASCLFVVGSRVEGGRVFGTVPALVPEELEDRRDLPVTTDFRSVFSEVAGVHLRIHNDDTLFPGWRGGRLRVMKG